MFHFVDPMAGSRRSPRGGHNSVIPWVRFLAALTLIFIVISCLYASWPDKQRVATKLTFFASTKSGSAECLQQSEIGPVLVSYSYFEKDDIQQQNLRFFLAVGMGYSEGFRRPAQTDFTIVISGDKCSPCEDFLPRLTFEPAFENPSGEIAKLWTGAGITVLQRIHNEGMDFAAHNVSTASKQYLTSTTSPLIICFKICHNACTTLGGVAERETPSCGRDVGTPHYLLQDNQFFILFTHTYSK
jgi:hypothetical protein